MHQITHPTKEQVRAYMAQREAARRPPPSPEEIRRQLGWCCGPYDNMPVFSNFLDFLPGKFSQLAALLALEWVFSVSQLPGRPPGCDQR